MKELTVIEIKEENALELFTTEKGLESYLKKIEEQALSIVQDVTTKKGRDQIASTAYKVRQSKAAMDKVGKALTDKLKEQPKLVDAERKRMRDFLDKLADEIRKPLDEFEKAEEDRVNSLKDKVAFFDVMEVPEMTTSEQLKAIIEHVKSIVIDESYQEFETEAHRAKEARINQLNSLLEKTVKHEKEQAELEELRKIQAEREQKEREKKIAREAEEKAKREADELAEKQKQDAINRENELKLQVEQAKREKLEAEERARQSAIETEERIKREHQKMMDREAAELARREANTRHNSKINNAAMNAIMSECGLLEETAKEVVKAIAKGLIPNVRINY